MKVLLVNSSPNEKGCTWRALSEVASSLEKNGVAAELLYLGSAPLSGCMDCGACSSGSCAVDDVVNQVGQRLDDMDGLIIGSPVYYASACSQACAFMDRLFFAYGRKLAGKVGAAVVSCRRGGSTAALDRLNKYFTICNMPIASSQYWNQVHGNTPQEVEQDKEGLQIMRTLGANMAWLLKCIEAGRAAGVAAPQYEPRQFTNFIR